MMDLKTISATTQLALVPISLSYCTALCSPYPVVGRNLPSAPEDAFLTARLLRHVVLFAASTAKNTLIGCECLKWLIADQAVLSLFVGFSPSCCQIAFARTILRVRAFARSIKGSIANFTNLRYANPLPFSWRRWFADFSAIRRTIQCAFRPKELFGTMFAGQGNSLTNVHAIAFLNQGTHILPRLNEYCLPVHVKSSNLRRVVDAQLASPDESKIRPISEGPND